MELHELAEPVYLAGRRIRSLQDQIGDVRSLLDDSDGVAEELVEEAKAIEEEVGDILDDMGALRQATRLSGAIQGSATRPTADQLWQIDRAWNDATEVISRLNVVIEERMPALNRQLDEHGIRPSAGEPVSVPRRRGG